MRIVYLLIAVLGLALLTQIAFAVTPPREREVAHATWEFYPKTLREARQLSTAIVVGRVVAIAQAPDTVSTQGSIEYRERSQRITIEVLKPLTGTIGARLVIYHWGDDSKYIVDDPPYAVGETGVFFLRRMTNEPNTYTIVAPQGRYRVRQDKLELMPGVNSIPFAQALSGKPIAALEQALAEAAQSH